MVVSDINMVRRVSSTINRCNLSSLAMLFTTLTLITLLVDSVYSSVSYGPGIKSLGGTVPSGDIVLEYGSGVPLEITCNLQSDTIIVQNLFHVGKDSSNTTKFPSHRIMFYKNAEIVPKQYVTIVNATAARLRIPNLPAGQDTYYCTLLLDYEHRKNESHGNSSVDIIPSYVSSTLPTVGHYVTGSNTNGSQQLGSQVGVCLNRVYVGYKPAIVKNFTCISENWVNLRCNWNVSENPIKTTYTLIFRLPSRTGGRIFIKCPTDSDVRENSCYWDFNTTPMYRQPYEFYDFRLNGQNVLGNSSSFFNFHHYANIIPASPINITVVDKTESSAMLRWSVGPMTNFPRELIYKIEYKSQWDSNPEDWHSVITSDVMCIMSLPSNQTNSALYTMNCQESDNDYYYFNVTDLKYPSAHYDFRIYVRSSLARGEDKWSPPGSITLKTKSSIIPASPINITVVDKTESSAMLRWSVGPMTNFPRELIYKIEYKSQWDSNPEDWHSVITSDVMCIMSLPSNQTNSALYTMNCQESDNDYYYFNVTDLKYPSAHYDFRIYVRSSLARGEDKWSPPGSITLKTKSSIIPASPINITVVDKTESSAMLRWSVGPMTNFPRELIYKIEYKSQWDSNPEDWHSVITSDVMCIMSLPSNQTNSALYTMNCQESDNDYYYFNVTDLKYPSAHYDFRIYVRSSLARGEDKWSPPGSITLKTKSSIPRRPPRTDIGSFESIKSLIDKSKRNIYIYWQQVNDSEKCGDSFEYRAYYTSTTEQNKSTIHYSNEVYDSYAKFKELSTSVGYNFTVYSSNKEGLSTKFSTIYVPSESQGIEKPILLTKMAFNEQGVFELSWKNSGTTKLSTADELNYYTLFWCDNVNRHPYQCNGYMNWTHVPSSELRCNVTILNYNVENYYRFAISSNSERLVSNNGTNSDNQINCKSSGMVWESCTIQNNITARKVENVWVSVISSTFIGLRWNIDCADRMGLFGEYQIYYCVAVSTKNNVCNGFMFSKTISREAAQKEEGFTLITNLEPNTTYIVSIAISTNDDKSIHSDPLQITTLGLGEDWYLKQEYPKFVATIN